MKKKLIITEEEKINIKKQYNINEVDSEKIIQFLQQFAGKSNTSPSTSLPPSTSSPSSTSPTSIGSGNLNNFENVTKIVIDKFEGGYWNPFCPHPKKGMGKSTETMFGIDRYNGNIEAKPDGKEFFEIIDKEKYDLGAQSTGSGIGMQWTNMEQFCKKWKWLYRGGDKEEILRNLGVKIMKGFFDDNMSNFVKNPKVKEKIETVPPLTLHMSYASWNGPLFFKNFAKSLEAGINQGMSDSQLIDQAISDREKTVLKNQNLVANEMKKLMT